MQVTIQEVMAMQRCWWFLTLKNFSICVSMLRNWLFEASVTWNKLLLCLVLFQSCGPLWVEHETVRFLQKLLRASAGGFGFELLCQVLIFFILLTASFVSFLVFNRESAARCIGTTEETERRSCWREISVTPPAGGSEFSSSEQTLTLFVLDVVGQNALETTLL